MQKKEKCVPKRVGVQGRKAIRCLEEKNGAAQQTKFSLSAEWTRVIKRNPGQRSSAKVVRDV